MQTARHDFTIHFDRHTVAAVTGFFQKTRDGGALRALAQYAVQEDLHRRGLLDVADELVRLCEGLGEQTDRQISWLQTRIKQAAPQALVVSS